MLSLCVMIWSWLVVQKKACYIIPASLLSSWIHILPKSPKPPFNQQDEARGQLCFLGGLEYPFCLPLSWFLHRPLPSTLVCSVPLLPSSQNAPPASVTQVLVLLPFHNCLTLRNGRQYVRAPSSNPSAQLLILGLPMTSETRSAPLSSAHLNYLLWFKDVSSISLDRLINSLLINSWLNGA